MALNIGRKIKDVLYEKRMSSSEFAQKLGKSPKGISRLLSKQDLHCKLLKQISELLGHNFFQYYMPAAEAKAEEKNDLSFYKEKIAVQEKEIEMLKKENSYLKQMNELLAGKK